MLRVKNIVLRIVLASVGAIGMIFSLIYVEKNYDVLLATSVLCLLSMVATKESRKILAVFQWALALMYVGFLLYTMNQQNCNILVLIGVSCFMLMIIGNRLKNSEKRGVQLEWM